MEKNDGGGELLAFFGGMALVGLLARSGETLDPRLLAEQALDIGAYMSAEHRRICDGSKDV
jgi:hypothetical protein